MPLNSLCGSQAQLHSVAGDVCGAAEANPAWEGETERCEVGAGNRVPRAMLHTDEAQQDCLGVGAFCCPWSLVLVSLLVSGGAGRLLSEFGPQPHL